MTTSRKDKENALLGYFEIIQTSEKSSSLKDYKAISGEDKNGNRLQILVSANNKYKAVYNNNVQDINPTSYLQEMSDELLHNCFINYRNFLSKIIKEII